jgi:hypothetical protein
MKGTCIVLGLALAGVHVSAFGADNTDQAKWNSCNDQARDLAGAAWKSSMDHCMGAKANSIATASKKAPVNSTKDKITGLPVYPGVANPNPLPTTVVCKSQTSGEFFIASGETTRDVANWYTAALPGFKKFAAVIDGRSQDTYFSADGTQEVTITGRPNSPEVYSISYGRFHPGLSTSAMGSFNTGKMICGRT